MRRSAGRVLGCAAAAGAAAGGLARRSVRAWGRAEGRAVVRASCLWRKLRCPAREPGRWLTVAVADTAWDMRVRECRPESRQEGQGARARGLLLLSMCHAMPLRKASACELRAPPLSAPLLHDQPSSRPAPSGIAPTRPMLRIQQAMPPHSRYMLCCTTCRVSRAPSPWLLPAAAPASQPRTPAPHTAWCTRRAAQRPAGGGTGDTLRCCDTAGRRILCTVTPVHM
jgi:hypothetical protein